MRPRRAWTVSLSLAAAALLGASSAQAITREEIVARAREWSDAGLLYCGSVAGVYDASCKYVCDRQKNPAWDAYRSDCSGLVSWAWGLPPPGPSTQGFAPYGGTQSFVIAPADLQPGDALNDRTKQADGSLHHHIMLFAGWASPGVARIIQESNCGKPASEKLQTAQIVGDRVQVGPNLYYPVRYKQVTGSCEAHCEGSVLVDASCGKGDCAAYGATCTKDTLGVRCVYTACPKTGTADVCLDQDHIATCKDGLPTNVGDCSAYAAYCSTAGGKTHCASHFCAPPDQTPVAHTTCFIDGSILTCDAAGNGSTSACPAGTKCSVSPTPHCDANNGCPPTGDVRLCLGGKAVRCYSGTLAEAVDCAAQGLECGVVGSIATCLESHTNDDDPPGTAGGAGAAGAAGTAGAAGAKAGASGGGAGGVAGAKGGGAGASASSGKAGSGGSTSGGVTVKTEDPDGDGGCAVPRGGTDWIVALLAPLGLVAASRRRDRRRG